MAHLKKSCKWKLSSGETISIIHKTQFWKKNLFKQFWLGAAT